MAKPKWARELAAKQSNPKPKKGSVAAPSVATTNRTNQPEATEAVPADKEKRPHRISTHLSDKHNALFTKITYAIAMETGRRPLPCEVIEQGIELMAKKYGIDQ